MNLRTIDHKLTCLLHDQSGKKPWLDTLAIFCARDLPFGFVFFALVSILYAFGFFGGHGSAKIVAVYYVVFMIIMIGCSQLIAYFVQNLIHRKRPFQSEDLHPIFKARIPSPSFPSGHATLVSVVLWMNLPLLALGGVTALLFGILLFMGMVILLARVYGGLHYLSDIIAGLIFGPVLFWTLSSIMNVIFLAGGGWSHMNL